VWECRDRSPILSVSLPEACLDKKKTPRCSLDLHCLHQTNQAKEVPAGEVTRQLSAEWLTRAARMRPRWRLRSAA
ncbi:MAG: hypothetical protein ACPIOQ_03580, partial [Promethearchaeia archaeon]